MVPLIKITITFLCVLLLTSCLRTRKDIAYDRPGYGSENASGKQGQAYNPGGYNVPPSATNTPNYKAPGATVKPAYNPPAINNVGGSNPQLARMQINMQEINTQLRELSGRLEVVEKQVSQNNLNVSSINIDQKLKNYEIALANLEAKVGTGSSVGRGSIQTTSLNAFGRGESQFKQKQWQKAIAEYQLYREQHPKGKDYPEATYKIGVCFQELSLKSEAKSFYEEAVSKYPKSKAAKKSKFRLKQL